MERGHLPENHESARSLPAVHGELAPAGFQGGSSVSWCFWLTYRDAVRAKIAKFRVPSGVDVNDFRQAALERAEVRFLRASQDHLEIRSVAGFLGVVVRSAVLDELEARKRSTKRRAPLPGHSLPAPAADDWAESELPAPSSSNPALAFESTDRTQRLIAALETLAMESHHSLRFAKAILWRCIEDKPPKEVASRLGVTVRQVNRYILVGLAKLRAILRANGVSSHAEI